jgi:signal peptidase I
VAAAVVALLVAGRAYFGEPFKIEGGSMEPTLRGGDRVLVDKRAYDDAPPRRGELVAFDAPGGDGVLLKRVVAVAGDTVGIEDGLLVVDGRRPREPYADQKSIDSVYFGPVKVRPGTVFVLGDNRANSEDSRDFGGVPVDDVIGRARTRIWPPSRWGEPR